MKHIRNITATPAYAFGEVQPNVIVKTLEALTQGLLFGLRKKVAGKEPSN